MPHFWLRQFIALFALWFHVLTASLIDTKVFFPQQDACGSRDNPSMCWVKRSRKTENGIVCVYAKQTAQLDRLIGTVKAGRKYSHQHFLSSSGFRADLWLWSVLWGSPAPRLASILLHMMRKQTPLSTTTAWHHGRWTYRLVVLGGFGVNVVNLRHQTDVQSSLFLWDSDNHILYKPHTHTPTL